MISRRPIVQDWIISDLLLFTCKMNLGFYPFEVMLNTSKHWDPKVRRYYMLDRGEKEIMAIDRSWLPHRACGVNCLFKYVKENQSLSFKKK